MIIAKYLLSCLARIALPLRMITDEAVLRNDNFDEWRKEI